MSTTDPNPTRQPERPPWLIGRDLDAVAAHQAQPAELAGWIRESAPKRARRLWPPCATS